MTARETALAIIGEEHGALTRVLHTLQALLARVEAGVAAPEFDLFSAALYYIDEFQERCHHPKEEELLFRTLTTAATRYSGTIETLQAGHRHGAQAMAALYRALVHAQGGARDGLKLFRAGVDAYAAAMFEHMRAEDELYAQCADVLDEQAWAGIAAAFGANDDPLFGEQRRAEFGRLYRRIQRLAPRKLRQELR